MADVTRDERLQVNAVVVERKVFLLIRIPADVTKDVHRLVIRAPAPVLVGPFRDADSSVTVRTLRPDLDPFLDQGYDLIDFEGLGQLFDIHSRLSKFIKI